MHFPLPEHFWEIVDFWSVFEGLGCFEERFEESQRVHNRLSSIPLAVLPDTVCLKVLKHCNLLCFSTFETSTPHLYHAAPELHTVGYAMEALDQSVKTPKNI